MPAVSKFYRRPPGIGWVVALIAVPLLLALIGWNANRSGDTATPPSGTASESATAPATAATTNPPLTSAPNSVYAPLSVQRNGNTVTLTGDVTDASARTDLVDLLKRSFGADVNVVDNLNVKPGVNTPDLVLVGSVFKAAAEIPDFSMMLNGDTTTLTGTAPTEGVKSEVEAAARLAWPNVTIVNSIQVKPAAPPTGAPPTGAPTSAPPPPPPAPVAQCASLQSDINAMLRTPITFVSDGATLSQGSRQALSQIATKLKDCSTARISVVGHTDSSGNDAINMPLSLNRAKAVAEYLISQGVAVDRITTRGAGAQEPVGPNDTPAGKAANRRTDITVS